METRETTQEQPSPIGQLRFDVIEAQTEKLFPWDDEMAGDEYIVSDDDARSIVEATLQEIQTRGMFLVEQDNGQIEALVNEITAHLTWGGHQVSLTTAVDSALMICLHSNLIEKPKSREER